MAVLIEPSWYRKVVSESEQRGWLQGEQKRLKQGIFLFLELKFGEAGLNLNEEIQEVEEVEILERILMAITAANTIEELREIYQNHPSFSK